MAFCQRRKNFGRIGPAAVNARKTRRPLVYHRGKRPESLLQKQVMVSKEIRVRSATNADIENIKQLVFGVLREYHLNPDPNGTDADLNDIEANYIERGGVFEILEDDASSLLGTVGL